MKVAAWIMGILLLVSGVVGGYYYGIFPQRTAKDNLVDDKPPEESSPKLGTKELVKEARASVYKLVCFDLNGKPDSSGSGFVVSGNGMLVTNFHVIENAYSVKAVSDRGGEFKVAGILDYDRKADWALLKLEGQNFDFLTFSKNEDLEPGTELTVIGSPRGLKNSVSSGILSAIRNLDDMGTSSLFQITAPISPGSSGSPVFLNDGKVVGVAVSILKNGQNTNFAVPAKELVSFVKNSLREPTLTVFPVKEEDQSYYETRQDEETTEDEMLPREDPESNSEDGSKESKLEWLGDSTPANLFDKSSLLKVRGNFAYSDSGVHVNVLIAGENDFVSRLGPDFPLYLVLATETGHFLQHVSVNLEDFKIIPNDELYGARLESHMEVSEARRKLVGRVFLRPRYTPLFIRDPGENEVPDSSLETKIPPLKKGDSGYMACSDGSTWVWNNNYTVKDLATWEGEVDSEGYANGMGTLSWYVNGVAKWNYTGHMRRGKFHGEVQNTNADKSVGVGRYEDGRRTGVWRYRSKTGKTWTKKF